MNLEAIYPDPHNPNVEYCFEELRAAQRGWLQRDWRKNSTPSEQTTPRSPLTEVALEAHNNSPDHVQDSSQKLQTLPLNDLYNQNDENRPPLEKSPSQKMSLARKMRREEKANRTRKIKVREVRGETQTSQLMSLTQNSNTCHTLTEFNSPNELRFSAGPTSEKEEVVGADNDPAY